MHTTIFILGITNVGFSEFVNFEYFIYLVIYLFIY